MIKGKSCHCADTHVVRKCVYHLLCVYVGPVTEHFLKSYHFLFLLQTMNSRVF